jgi:hypothetical protein
MIYVRHVNQLLLDWSHSNSEEACVKRRMACPQLMSPVTWGPLRHQPHRTPGEGYLECSAGEVLFLRGVQRHHPLAAGLVDGPGAVNAAVRNRSSQGVLPGTAFECQIDAGVGDRTEDTPRVISRCLLALRHLGALTAGDPAAGGGLRVGSAIPFSPRE